MKMGDVTASTSARWQMEEWFVNHFATDMGGRLDRGSTFLTSLEVEVHERGATWYLLGGFFQCRDGILGCEVARISASRIR